MIFFLVIVIYILSIFYWVYKIKNVYSKKVTITYFVMIIISFVLNALIAYDDVFYLYNFIN